MEAHATVVGSRGWAAPREGVARPGWGVPAFLGGCVLVALALRLTGLHWSLTGDELFAYDDIHGRSLAGMLHYIAHNSESSPPLFFILAWAVAHVGDATTVIRLPSIILGAATVPVVYALARRCVGRPAALLSAALFALDPLAVWQGAEARPYGMLMFTSALSALVLLVALDARAWSRWWILYAVSAAAVVYTHYTGAFVLGAQTVWALWSAPARRRELIAATLGAGILYLPWLPSYHGAYLGVYNALDVPLVPGQIARTFLQGLIGHPAFTSLHEFPGLGPTILFGLAMLAALGVAGRARLRRGGLGRADAGPVLIIALAVATPVGILVYSAVSYDLLLVRNLAASLPFALIVVAWTAVSVRRDAPALAVVVIAVVVGVYVLGAVKSLSGDDARADFRGALAWVNARSRPGDALIDGSLFPLVDGYRRLVPVYLNGRYAVTTRGTAVATSAWARVDTGARVFVFVQRSGLFARYRAPRFDGLSLVCERATGATPGCVPLRATRTFGGLQPLVVSEYALR